ncbi:MAG TPA: hypothetical protein VIJ92_10160 [Ginsengibacter sp.]
MNFPKLKAILFGVSCFAFASAFAQDTPKTPKPDTTKMPRHDSTSMNLKAMHNDVVSFNVTASHSFITKNEKAVALKKEAEDETLTEKYFAKTSV